MKAKLPQLWEWQIAGRGIIRLAGLFLLYSLPTGVLMLMAQSISKTINLLQALVILALMSFMLAFIIKYARRLEFMEKSWSLKALWTYKGVILLGLLAQILLDIFLPMLLDKLHLALPTSDNQALLNAAADRVPILLMIFMTSIYAPVSEEIIFRAGTHELLFPFHQRLALLTSSLLFALAHMGFSLDWRNWLIYLGLGLVLGLVYQKTQHIECSMAVHVLMNSLVSILNLS